MSVKALLALSFRLHPLPQALPSTFRPTLLPVLHDARRACCRPIRFIQLEGKVVDRTPKRAALTFDERGLRF